MDIIYKIYLLLIQMQLRVPNQYKPSFLENLLSPFVPVPTRRILSDKKLQKQKKINLSLTEDTKTKSTRKIKISNSFDSKATPSTNEHHTNKVSQFSTLRRGIGTHARGLNFHPRKINFQNQGGRRDKIKSEGFFGLGNQSGTQDSRDMLVLDRNNEKKVQQQTQYRVRDQKVASFFSNNYPSTILPEESKYSNPNPEFSKTIDRDSVRGQNSTKNKTEDSDRVKCRIHQDIYKPAKQYVISPPLKGLLKNRARLQIKDCPIKQLLPKKQSIIYIQNIDPITQTSPSPPQPIHEPIPQTPTRPTICQPQPQQNQPLRISRPISNLFQNAMTIQSKNDGSSKRSISDCYSNVIERIKIEEIRCDVDETPRDWDEMRRRTLQANLLSKFQQNKQIGNIQSIRQTVMDFRKKKSDLESEYRLSSREDFDGLKYIEETYINNDVDLVPIQDVSSEVDDKPNTKKTIYEVFTKIKYLGVGRFASVYLCQCPSTNFLFAIKQILKFTISYNNLLPQLQNQLQLQQESNNAHILNLYNFWQDNKKYYLALEYGQQTLLNRIEAHGRGLPQGDCVGYLRDICQGLLYLHHRGIVHRDLKPENVVVVNGVCKVGDFGWAARIGDGYLSQPCGTPGYISPKMEKGQSYSTKTDCYSLGVLAYELIAGKLPEHHFQTSPTPSSLSLPLSLPSTLHISPQYLQLLQSLLQEQQQNRPSIAQVLRFPIFNGL